LNSTSALCKASPPGVPLTDKRAAVQRDDIDTRDGDLQRLRRACQAP